MSVLTELATRGVLSSGTLLEVAPEAMPADAPSHDPRAFQARR